LDNVVCDSLQVDTAFWALEGLRVEA